MINNRRIARRYAKAFIHDDISSEMLTRLAEEVKAIANAFAEDNELEVFFASPVSSRKDKIKALEGVVKRLEFSSFTQSLVELLIRKDRIAILNDVAEELQELSDKMIGQIRVTLTTAVEPSVEDIETISERIGKFFNSKAVVERKIDASLVGGFKLEGDGKLMDLSIQGQIKKILTRV